MNGIIPYLLFCSLLAQSNISPLGSAASNSSVFDQDNASRRTQYGWQLNVNGELEYLIQISPEMLPAMTQQTNKQEFQCEIPRELVGRVHRVVVSIGNDVLPRTPTLQEIQQRIPTIASLPAGRMRDLESGASLVEVQQTLPDFPSTSDSRLGGRTAPENSAAPTTPLGSAFIDQARSNTSSPSSRNPNDPNALPSYSPGTGVGQSTALSGLATPPASSPPSDRFADTASGQPISTAPPPRSFPTESPALNANNLAGGNTGSYPNTPAYNPSFQNQNYDTPNAQNVAQPRSQQTPNFNSPQGVAENNRVYDPQYQTNNQPYGAGNDYGRQQTNYPSTSSGYGRLNGTPGQSVADRMSNSLASDQPMGRPGADAYLASNRPTGALYDGQRSANDAATSMGLDRETESTRNSAAAGVNNALTTATDNNYPLFVFFVLSVAVNLWMVHLLRSLYVRYRNLLATLRGHVA